MTRMGGCVTRMGGCMTRMGGCVTRMGGFADDVGSAVLVCRYILVCLVWRIYSSFAPGPQGRSQPLAIRVTRPPIRVMHSCIRVVHSAIEAYNGLVNKRPGAQELGFVLRVEEERVCHYTQGPRSMMETVYHCALFVAVKA